MLYFSKQKFDADQSLLRNYMLKLKLFCSYIGIKIKGNMGGKLSKFLNKINF